MECCPFRLSFKACNRFPGGTLRSSILAAKSTYSSFRRARTAIPGGNRLAVPFRNRSRVRLSANVLIMGNVACHVTPVKTLSIALGALAAARHGHRVGRRTSLGYRDPESLVRRARNPGDRRWRTRSGRGIVPKRRCSTAGCCSKRQPNGWPLTCDRANRLPLVARGKAACEAGARGRQVQRRVRRHPAYLAQETRRRARE